MDEVLGRYRLGGRIAAGALGTVVAATDLRTGQEVAVKFFDGSQDNFGAWTKELRLALRLRHPHIAPCIDVGLDAATGLCVMVFQRALGGSLRRTIAAGQWLAPAEVGRLLDEIAAALEHAHAHGVVHRDIKPENILARDRPGAPPWLLTDFGSGLFLARGAQARSLAGSLPYMAPEVLGRAADLRSDLYSLGVVGLELLTGTTSDQEGRSRFRLAPRPGVAGAVAWLLAPDPELRPPAAAAVRRVLAEEAGPWDATRTSDGTGWLLVGNEVLAYGEAAGGRAARVHVGRRFVNLRGEATAIVAAVRRVVALTPGGLRTVVAAERPFEAFAASVEHGAWGLRGDEVIVIDGSGRAAGLRLRLPAAWTEALAVGARPLGATLGPDAAVLGVVGVPLILWTRRIGAELEARLLAAEAGLQEFVRVGGHVFALCGDATMARLYEVDRAGGIEPRARAPLAVDAVRVLSSGTGWSLAGLWPSVSVCVDDEVSSDGGYDGAAT